MDLPIPSRRQFLTAIGELASAGWIAMNWPQIALAAEQAGHDMHDMKGMSEGDAPPTTLKTLSPAEAAEVDAIANQIVPGGASPGARDASVIYFIDNALGSFFAAQLPAFKKGLADFQSAYAGKGTGKPFSAAPDAQQVAWLKTVDKTPFFAAVRRLTLLGLIALPKYGGNHDNLGWKLLGVEDSHVWEPPFGWYDKDYAGFQPYPGTKPYTA
jgi:gluconate 2-dehydrogenase gamma chain